MLRTTITALALGFLCGGCPDRDELVDQVGGAPGRQMQDGRVRTKAAEVNMQKAADAANAVQPE